MSPQSDFISKLGIERPVVQYAGEAAIRIQEIAPAGEVLDNLYS